MRYHWRREGPPPKPKHFTPEYSIYMRSKAWFEKRREAINFYGRKCSRCPQTRCLEVHHRTYERLGNELMEDLEVVCRTCHDIEHGKAHPRMIKDRKPRVPRRRS